MTATPLHFNDRAQLCTNPLTKRLLTLIHDKQTNLGLSADVNQAKALLALADALGPEICVLKTHIDTLDDFYPELTDELAALAKKHNFLIFEDRKFADIGSIVQKQYRDGVYHIADWADLVTVHSLPGPGILAGLAEVGMPLGRGALLLAEMSSADNFLTAEYAQKTLALAEQFPDFVVGFISQRKLTNDPRWVYLTPGVKLEEGKDTLGQRYVTPERAIKEQGSDVIIVGRGIIQAKDPVAEAKIYRERGWKAYR